MGNVVEVSNGAELMAAMNNASGGDTIKLQPGDYDVVSLRDYNFDSPVTITSADPDNPAHLENLYIRNSSNITVEKLAIHSEDGPLSSWGEHLAYVGESSNIVLNDNKFGNDSPTAKADGFIGLSVSNSTGVDVTGNEFSNLGNGAAFSYSQDLNISDNYVHDIRSDGFHFTSVQRVDVTGNTIKDFYPAAGDSADYIQFVGLNGVPANTDIVIRDNSLLQGDGEAVKAIFMNTNSADPFENVLIENNVIYQSGYHGISVYNAEGLEITQNTIISPPGTVDEVRILVNNASDAVIEDNITNLLSISGDDVLISGNGADVMMGGEGSDLFKFTDENDSGIGAGNRDTITDFDANGVDHISFEGLVSGSFDFIGDEVFFEDSSNAQARFDDSTKILSVDLDGDQVVDMEIELIGVSISDLDNTDFLI